MVITVIRKSKYFKYIVAFGIIKKLIEFKRQAEKELNQ